MAIGWTCFFLLCWFSFLFLTGVNLFSRGFLLRRVALANASICLNGPGPELHALNSNRTMDEFLNKKNGCWLPPRFNKAIVLIIDGLRFDFISYNESVADSLVLPYQNKFTVVHSLLRDQPQNSALFKFVADPPTTTMQRIKGLITGSLPTFIDISDNFASHEIEEDNIIHQLVAQNKNITFLGDDTWMGLLPQKFKKYYPFPSFNVKDLHTVDNGIVEHLVPEILGKDWDVLVAHFLGVDHCGHRYGPHHVAMENKLSQMNEVIREVINSMDLNTALFVMGDHGMTKTGDHGGDSTDETSSALFVYSKKALRNVKDSLPFEVNQIDFVPTFALLMGIPIPFGNLGKVIPSLYIHESRAGNSSNGNSRNWDFGALALYTNTKQVELYLKHYNSISQELTLHRESFAKLEHLLAEIEDLWRSVPLLPPAEASASLSSIRVKCAAYLTLARSICQKVWAQFDSLSMIAGMCIFAAGLVLASGQVFLQLHLSLKLATTLFVFSLVGSVFQIHVNFPFLNSVQGTESIIVVAITAASILVYMCCSWRGDKTEPNIGQDRSASSKVVFICGISSFSFLFSNSFVINEASLSCYFLITILWWEVFTSYLALRKPSNDNKRKSRMDSLPKSRILCILFMLMSTLCIRISSIFWKCREEQWWCEGTNFLRPLASIPADTAERLSYKNWRFFISICCMSSVVIAARWLMRKAGNMNGFLPAVLCASYIPPFMGISIGFYWALQGLTSTAIEETLLSHQLHIPNVVFLVAISGMLVVFARPLCIYSIHNEVDEIGPTTSYSAGELLQHVYRHLKANWQNYLSSSRSKPVLNSKPLMVYGLATVFSAPLITVNSIVLLTMMLLSSDGLAPAFLLLVLSKAFILYCLASLKENAMHDQSSILKVPWSWIMLWSFFASVEFYATGHQQTFPALYWESTMIGSDGNFSNHVLPAAKVLLNTYSSSILAGIGLPILFLWPLSNHIIFHKQSHFLVEASDSLKKGEFFMFENPVLFSGLFHLTCKYFIIQGAKLFVSMAAAALLRRHLMVWKIFAPRFLFEAVNFCVTIPAVLYGFLLMMSVHRALASWMKSLDHHEHSS